MPMHESNSISVIIPVYNSAATLPSLIDRVKKVLQDHGESFEIILVNDGSMDHTWDLIVQMADQSPLVRGIDLAKNYGQHSALLCGIRAAKHAIVVTLDDDLQNPPEEIPRLLAKLDEGHDVVYGVPEVQQHGWWRGRASILTKFILRHVMGVANAPDVSAFRAFRACLVDGFADFRSPFVSIDVLLSWSTSRFAGVTVRHVPRQFGQSNYRLTKLVQHAINLTTGFSTAPLHLASIVGFSVMLFGLAVLTLVLGRYWLEGCPVAGFPFLAATGAIFAGTQLFSLGIIGTYLARVHFRLLDKPAYVIRQAHSLRGVSRVLPLGRNYDSHTSTMRTSGMG